MNARLEVSSIGWTLGLLIATLILSGCSLTWRMDREPNTSYQGQQIVKEEVGRPSGVREVKVGVSGSIVMKEVEVGKMADGYLVKVTWTDNLQLVRLLCENPQASGCQRSEIVPPGKETPAYRRQLIVVYVREAMSDLTLKIMTHEICHAVASSQNLEPDPCHNENGGRI